MVHTFQNLPQKISFVYGSIFGIRRQDIIHKTPSLPPYVEDNAYGYLLHQSDKLIHFVPDLKVIHLKRYTMRSWIVNDYLVPMHFVSILMNLRGWNDLKNKKGGFMQIPLKRNLSLLIASIIPFIVFAFCLSHEPMPLIIAGILFSIWFMFNHSFFQFLKKERGILFSIKSVMVTYLDHMIMLTGIISGLIAVFKRRLTKENHDAP
jgi:GT2 family glycosyltransferase